MRKKILFPFFLMAILFAAACQPSLTPEELDAKWRAPIVMAAFSDGVCQTTTETAQNVNSGETDGFTALGELLGASIMIQVIDEGLVEAEPSPDQEAFLNQMSENQEALRAVIGPWIDSEISSTEVLAQIGDVCQATTTTFEEVAEAASKDGMTDEAIVAILEEAAESMESSFEAAPEQ